MSCCNLNKLLITSWSLEIIWQKTRKAKRRDSYRQCLNRCWSGKRRQNRVPETPRTGRSEGQCLRGGSPPRHRTSSVKGSSLPGAHPVLVSVHWGEHTLEILPQTLQLTQLPSQTPQEGAESHPPCNLIPASFLTCTEPSLLNFKCRKAAAALLLWEHV